MKQVSLVIVNYNVKHFLDQCLSSVKKACEHVDAEVYVVDNASTDGSVEMIQKNHPWVKCIASKENLGFSKGNNLALRRANGEYVLLLNPDTIIEENTLKECIEFMNKRPDAGALGVKMIDGSGQFLPESKRGLPQPKAAFYKIFGLSKLFPNSKRFGKYHLSYLNKEDIHQIDVLSGAFMFIKKEALDKAGLFDEQFFMYGEDIDLSYRIQQAGYKNYYSPKPRIIHFKGESTKKNSLNYVKLFYGAMLIFYNKHFAKSSRNLFSFFIQIAIYLRAGASLFNRLLKKIWPFLLDALVLYAGMLYLVDYWEKNHRYIEGGKYPPEYLSFVVPMYILSWILAIYFSSGYDRPLKVPKLLKGVLFGTVFIVLVYAFLNENWRFSRALIVLGCAWACFALSSTRLILSFISNKGRDLAGQDSPRTLLVGSEKESQRILSLLSTYNAHINYIGRVFKEEQSSSKGDYLGNICYLKEYVRLYQAEEIIFCSADISYTDIIQSMIDLGNTVTFKIVPKGGFSAIGSRSKNESGELYSLDISWSIDSSENKRNKRLFDFIFTLLIIIASPLLIVVVKNIFKLYSNCFEVLFNQKSWIGFAHHKKGGELVLPKMKTGILPPFAIREQTNLDSSTIERLNLFYAKEYNLFIDCRLLLSNLKYLDYKSSI